MKFQSLNKKEYALLFSKGEKYFLYRDFVVYYAPSEFPKLGFAISKKFGNAVQRNKLKRQFRSLLLGGYFRSPQLSHYMFAVVYLKSSKIKSRYEFEKLSKAINCFVHKLSS